MNALLRLRHQIRDLTEQYVDEDGDQHRPLMTQLLVLGPHLRPSQDVVGKIQPRSTPPGNLDARQLYDTITGEAEAWAMTLAGHRVRKSQALKYLPTLAAQLDSDDQRLHARGPFEGARGHEHPTGLYSNVGRWHSQVRIALHYDVRPTHYPLATCPHCHYRDHRGGSIKARETLAWCANPRTDENGRRECADEHGFRREFSILYLQDLLRQAAYTDLQWVTAATGVPA